MLGDFPKNSDISEPITPGLYSAYQFIKKAFCRRYCAPVAIIAVAQTR